MEAARCTEVVTACGSKSVNIVFSAVVRVYAGQLIACQEIVPMSDQRS